MRTKFDFQPAPQHKRQIKWLRAIHECSHAATAFSLGIPVVEISIVPTLLADGHCKLAHAAADADQQLLISAAGDIGVELAQPGGIQKMDQALREATPKKLGEIEEAHEAIGLPFDPAKHLPSDAGAIADALAADSRARKKQKDAAAINAIHDFLRANWPGVIRCAEELYLEGTITGQRAAALLGISQPATAEA